MNMLCTYCMLSSHNLNRSSSLLHTLNPSRVSVSTVGMWVYARLVCVCLHMRANEINIFMMKVVFLAHKCFYKYDNEIQYPIQQFNDETFHSTHMLPFFLIFFTLFSSLYDWIRSSAP